MKRLQMKSLTLVVAFLASGFSMLAQEIDITMPESISATEMENLRAMQDQIPLLMKTLTYEGMYNDYQRTTNLTHDIYAGYFAANQPAFLINSPNYIYTEGWSGMRWKFFYEKRVIEYGNLMRMFRYLEPEAHRNAYYITRIYYAYLVSQMTDTYGDLPIAITVKGEPFGPYNVYDSQKSIYDMMFRMLKESVDNIKPNACAFKFGIEDKCYQGDEAKWVRFANTLRLRLALRISNVDAAWAKQEGEAALAANGGLMTSNDDNFKTVPLYAPVDQGGENSGGDENIHALCSFMYLDACMSKDLELAYKSQSKELDPRCTVCWYRPTPKDMLMVGQEILEVEEGREMVENQYKGVEIGSSEIDRTSTKVSVLKTNAFDPKGVTKDSHWFGYSRESLWMGYAESRFLLAEAALRGWTGADSAPFIYFEEGIRASFDYFRLSADRYLDGLKIKQPGENNPFEGTDKEAILEQIITQKWIAIMPNGSEGWAEFRRTDFPRLLNHRDNRSDDVPMNKFIKRVSYIYDEMDYNWENLPDANQGTRVWWDMYDTNDDFGNRLLTSNFPPLTGLDDAAKEDINQGNRVYPNPVSPKATVMVSTPGASLVRLITVQGQTVGEVAATGDLTAFLVGDVTPGIYFLVVEKAGDRRISKLMVK